MQALSLALNNFGIKLCISKKPSNQLKKNIYSNYLEKTNDLMQSLKLQE